MKLIKPFQKDEALLSDIRSFNSDSACKVWWLGQSGFLLKWQGKQVLFDPYLSDSLTNKYRDTDKPHERMSELVVNAAKLGPLSLVTSSHNHTDHLDADTLVPILENNPGVKLIIPEANRDFVCDRIRCDKNFPIGLNDGVSVECAGFTITGVPAAHNELERNDKGQCKYMGFVVQFGEKSVYHSGDTLWFDGLEQLLRPFQVDIALLPINGNKPERRVAGNLDPKEAALLAKSINAKLTIPHHYHLFEFNTEDPKLFKCECLAHHVNFKVLEIGEGIVVR